MKYGDGDHVLEFVSPSGKPGTFRLLGTQPLAWKGEEEGQTEVWWARQFLEPEALRVGGRWYLYTQVMVKPGQNLDQPGLKAVTAADRIQLFTSTRLSGLQHIFWKRISFTIQKRL